MFGAEVEGVRLSAPLDDATFGRILDAFDEYSVLTFRGQGLTDEQHTAFARRFGPLEAALKANPTGGTPLSRQSNIDVATGGIIPPTDRRMTYELGTYMWHSDSSFKRVPSLCSILAAREVPPEGGETEFASTRAAYAALPPAMKRRIEGLVAEHDLEYSLGLVDPDILTAERKAEWPPVRQAVVRTNPVNGLRSLFIGTHASHIGGWPVEEGRALLRELLEFATQPRFRYRHEWRVGDLVVWDNRCCLHRARAYDGARYRRLMYRATVAGDGPTV